jgi:hypothetical protein
MQCNYCKYYYPVTTQCNYCSAPCYSVTIPFMYCCALWSSVTSTCKYCTALTCSFLFCYYYMCVLLGSVLFCEYTTVWKYCYDPCCSVNTLLYVASTSLIPDVLLLNHVQSILLLIPTVLLLLHVHNVLLWLQLICYYTAKYCFSLYWVGMHRRTAIRLSIIFTKSIPPWQKRKSNNKPLNYRLSMGYKKWYLTVQLHTNSVLLPP